MKIEIDLEKSFAYTDIHELHSQAEYDALPNSPAGYQRECAASDSRSGQRRTCGRIEIYRSNPDRFPCILIENGVKLNGDSADEILTVYLYDYKKLDERKPHQCVADTTGED